MEPVSLTALASDLLTRAREASSGRQARTLYGGQEHHLRQTVIALAGGHGLDEHESPGEATLQVLQGAVRFVAGDDHVDLREGDHLVIPPVRHRVEAPEDSVLLLTTSMTAARD